MLSDLVREGMSPSDLRALLEQVFLQTRMAMCVTDPNQPDNPIIVVNQAFEELTGYSEGEIVGRNCRFLQGKDTDQGEIEKIKDCLDDKTVGYFELLNYKKDGTPFWNALHIGPVFDEAGKLVYYFGSQWDVTERAEAVAAVKGQVRLGDAQLQAAIDEARRLQIAIDQARDAVLLTDYGPLDEPGPRIVYASKGFERMTGYSAEEVIGKSPRILQGPSTDHEAMAEVREALQRDEAVQSSNINYKKDGTPYRVEWQIVPVPGANGPPTHWLSVQRDVTEKYEAEERLHLMAAELSHRQKNLFAVVRAILSAIPRDSLSAEDYHAQAMMRLGALIAAHDAVFSGEGEGASVAQFVGATIGHFGREGQVEAEGGPAKVGARAALDLGLALHELATNAAKHGALSVPEGKVRLEWAVKEGVLHLDWTETGGPAVETPEREGFGSKILNILAMGGEREDAGLFFHEDGVTFRGAMALQ